MQPGLLVAVGLSAALAFSASPAGAQQAFSRHEGTSHRSVERWASPDSAGCGGGERHHHGRRGDRFDCRAFSDGFAYADGEWARYNNRSWDPDSYNDWWNDRPDRAYPRWVQEQQARGTCEPDRMWWSGSGWHC